MESLKSPASTLCGRAGKRILVCADGAFESNICDQVVTGRARGIDRDGALIVEDDQGSAAQYCMPET